MGVGRDVREKSSGWPVRLDRSVLEYARFSALSRHIRDSAAETSSPQTAPTAILSAGAEIRNPARAGGFVDRLGRSDLTRALKQGVRSLWAERIAVPSGSRKFRGARQSHLKGRAYDNRLMHGDR